MASASVSLIASVRAASPIARDSRVRYRRASPVHWPIHRPMPPKRCRRKRSASRDSTLCWRKTVGTPRFRASGRSVARWRWSAITRSNRRRSRSAATAARRRGSEYAPTLTGSPVPRPLRLLIAARQRGKSIRTISSRALAITGGTSGAVLEDPAAPNAAIDRRHPSVASSSRSWLGRYVHRRARARGARGQAPGRTASG